MIALTFWGMVAAAAGANEREIPVRLRLHEIPAARDQETSPPTSEQERASAAPFMEYVYRFSQIEAGTIFTAFDGDLDIEADVGFYARMGVCLDDGFSVHAAYRHYDFDNSDAPGAAREHLLLRSILLGGGWYQELFPGFNLTAHLSGGFLWWNSRGADFDNDASPLLSGELGLTVWLHELLRLKIGGALDYTRTDFHRSSRRTALSPSGILALEFGW